MPSQVILAAELHGGDDLAPSNARIFLNKHAVRFIRDARAAWKAAESMMPDQERKSVRRLDLYFPFVLEAGTYDAEFDDMEEVPDDAVFEEDEGFSFYPHLLVDGDDFFFRLLPKYGDDTPETDIMSWADFEVFASMIHQPDTTEEE